MPRSGIADARARPKAPERGLANPGSTSPAPSRSSLLIHSAAAALLVLMGVLMFLSSWDDTPTSDDNVALISGYSYLRKQEYRLEPQNPPLIKDLAAVPLLFMNLHEPWGLEGWGQNNDPAVLGQEFLYSSGNDPDAILRAARTPMILFTVAFGALLFWWTEKEYGGATALLTLFFYTFSPTFLAHGRLVATDLGATAGFLVTVIALLRFLKSPRWANVILAGLAIGFAFLTKFSTIALIPIALLLAVLWVLVADDPARRRVLRWRKMKSGGAVLVLRPPRKERLQAYARYLARTACIIGIGYLLVYAVYLFHVWNYPPDVQWKEAQYHRVLYDLHGTSRDIMLWASNRSLWVRPWAEYLLGLLVALRASGWGQSFFFFGRIYPTGLPIYFPTVYLLKEPLAMHLLTLVALGFALSQIRRSLLRREPLRKWLAAHFTGVALAIVLAIYWAALIRSHMNIGVRHLLPAFPLTFILVSHQIVRLYRRLAVNPAAAWSFGLLLAGLLGWQAVGVLRVHPSYLAYFNELAEGPDGGWRYVNDSNLDWGQDVKRLAQFADARGIGAISVSTFGPADPAYYLKGKYQGPVRCGQRPRGWVAVSAMLYTGAPWDPGCDYRLALPMNKLVAKIGYSIFVFHVD